MTELQTVNLAHQAEAPRSALARVYAEQERLAIGSGALLAFLLIWEAFGRSGMIDPLFISSPGRVAMTGYALVQNVLDQLAAIGTDVASRNVNDYVDLVIIERLKQDGCFARLEQTYPVK